MRSLEKKSRLSVFTEWFHGRLFRRSPATRTFVAAALLFLGGCGGEQQTHELVPEDGTLLESVSIDVRSWDDMGQGRKAIKLHIENHGQKTLREVRLTLNGAYTASLSDLMVYEGFMDGAKTRGHATLAAGGSVDLTFSHDIANHDRMRSADGKSLPRDTRVRAITLRAADGRASWSCR